jgi:gentisate 1,2-dioxygenase
VKPILARAGELIGTDKAERRNLTMFNPVEGNVYSTLRSMVAAYQMIRPARRPAPIAIRLTLCA